MGAIFWLDGSMRQHNGSPPRLCVDFVQTFPSSLSILHIIAYSLFFFILLFSVLLCLMFFLFSLSKTWTRTRREATSHPRLPAFPNRPYIVYRRPADAHRGKLRKRNNLFVLLFFFNQLNQKIYVNLTKSRYLVAVDNFSYYLFWSNQKGI